MITNMTPISQKALIIIDKKLEQAIDTMKKLPVFGKNEYPIDYKWPKERDLFRMP